MAIAKIQRDIVLTLKFGFVACFNLRIFSFMQQKGFNILEPFLYLNSCKNHLLYSSNTNN